MTHKVKRYSETFRRQVVSEYEAGVSVPTLLKKYGIGSYRSVYRWVAKYGRAGLRHEVVRIQSAEEANRVKVLEAQVAELQKALGQVTLEKLKLESILDMLSGEVDEQAKKNGP